MVGLIFWDVYIVLDFRSKFLLIAFKMRKKLKQQFFFLNCYCDKRLLISKKVTLVVAPNIKVQSDVILVLSNVTIELSTVREKIGYH